METCKFGCKGRDKPKPFLQKYSLICSSKCQLLKNITTILHLHTSLCQCWQLFLFLVPLHILEVSIFCTSKIPSKSVLIRTVWRKAFTSKYTGSCGCNACRAKSKEIQIASRKPSAWGITKFVLYILCILLFIFFLRKATSESAPSTQVIKTSLFDSICFKL